MTPSILDIYRNQIAPTFVPTNYIYSNAITNPHTLEGKAFFDSFLYPQANGRTELEGIFDLAPLQGGKKFQLQAIEERNEQAEKFAAESNAFNLEMVKQGQASETFNANLEAANTRLSSIQAGTVSKASSASSAREYSGLAQNAMQATNRYLAELEKFKSPDQVQLDFTFKDPITGESLSADTSFDDVYSEGVDPQSRAREAVYGTFSDLTQKYESTLNEQMLAEYGNYEDYTINPHGFMGYGYEDVHLGSALGQAFIRNRPDSYKRGNSIGDRVMNDYIARFQEYDRARTDVTQTAEAFAMAEMTGYDSTMSYSDRYGTDMRSKDMSQALLFYAADHNKLLDDMYKNTTERMEIARLKDRAAVKTEFDRRQQAAFSQRELADAQLRRNSEQEQRIALEKQRVRQLQEQQRIEYAETLSSFGGSTVAKGDSIAFTDTRPQ